MYMAFRRLYSHQRQSGHLGLLLSVHRGEAEGKEGEVRSKSCQQSRVKKQSPHFYYKRSVSGLKKHNKTKTSPVSEGLQGASCLTGPSDHCPGLGFG